MADEIEELAATTGPLAEALGQLEGLADAFGRSLATAFRQAAVDGKRLEDVLRSLALALAGRALTAALAPIGQGIGGIIGGFFGAQAVSQGGAASARGGAGLPQAGGSGAGRTGAAVHVTFNVSTPDAQSFRRAEAELTAMLARTVARGRRGL